MNWIKRLFGITSKHQWSTVKVAAPPFWHPTKQVCGGCGLVRTFQFKENMTGPFMNEKNHEWIYSNGKVEPYVRAHLN
jgi:hypothetical protein